MKNQTMNETSPASAPAGSEISRLARNVAEDAKEEKLRLREGQHDQERSRAEARKRQQRLAIGLTLIFSVLTTINLMGLNPLVSRDREPTQEEIALSTLAAVEMLVDDLEAWHEDWGEFPESVEDLAVPIGAWSYSRLGDGYQVALDADGVTVEYESTQDRDEFFSPLAAGEHEAR